MADNTYIYKSVEDCAYGQKFSFVSFIEDWFEAHGIYDDHQRSTLQKAIRRAGWDFFHNELIEAIEMSPEMYEITYDGRVIVFEL